MGHQDQSDWEDEVREMEWFGRLQSDEINANAEAYFGDGIVPRADSASLVLDVEQFEKFPLLRFSLYSELQRRAVIKAGHEVLESLDRTQSSNTAGFHGAHLEDAYGRFFLWLCASYEIARTLRGAKDCLSRQLHDEIIELMIPLQELRVPFAKQQMPARGTTKRNVALEAECSILGVGTTLPDLQFKVNDTDHSARTLIEKFEAIFTSIARSDVLADLRVTQRRRSTARD